MTRNLYLALLFRERPDLHLTVRYYPKVEARGAFECNLVQKVGEFWRCSGRTQLLPMEPDEVPGPFAIDFSIPDRFGPRKNIPVLLPRGQLPRWVFALRNLVPPEKPDTYPFRPHVTTSDEGPLTLTVESICICHKSEVLWRWQV